MKKALYLLLTFPCFFLNFRVVGQNGSSVAGTVQGTLIDQDTRQPVGFANIILFQAADSSTIAGGAMTDEQGKFVVTAVPAGTFIPKVSLVGYAARRLPVITISPDKPTVNLGTISFSASSTRLQAVEIQGERPMVQYGLDRKVINVARDLTSVAGSATDVMKNVPSVTVDADGGISMRGSSNLRILIDGRPTGMVVDNQAQILEQIPASSIESIEVITNPSSKFEAEGEGGIINIILKKEKREGYNGLASVNVGTNNRYNTSLSGNYRYRNFNFYGSYDFRQDNRNGYGHQNRYTFYEGRTTYLDQDQSEMRNNTNHAGKLGLDYSVTPRHTLSGSVAYRNRYSREKESVTNQIFNTNQVLTEHYTRDNRENDLSDNYDFNLGYRQTFAKKGRELTADVIYSTSTGGESQQFTQLFTQTEESAAPIYDRSNTNESNSQVTAQVDFTNPIGKNGKLDAGYRTVISSRNDDYQFENFKGDSLGWINNPGISNNFIFDQQVHGLYATFGNKIGKTSYQFGGRLEYTQNKGVQKTLGVTAPDTSYLNFFPSVFITHEINKENQFQVNYSRRINRPGMGDLNPFVDVSDPLNPRAGNPRLRPEFSNAFEVSQIHYGSNDFSLNTTLFFRQTNDVIQRYRQIIDTAVTFNTDINLASRRSYGVELVASQTFLKIWKVNGNVSGFRSVLTGTNEGTNLNNQNFSWTARLNSILTLWKGLDFQFSANYRSPILLSQGTMEAVYFTEMALKKDVLRKKGTITFRLNDIFNTQEFTVTQAGENFRSDNYRKRQSRIAFVGFSYRFGDMGGQNKKRDRRNQDDDNDNSEPDLD
jgi:outer membrane receptor protein involved in Fe transport